VRAVIVVDERDPVGLDHGRLGVAADQQPNLGEPPVNGRGTNDGGLPLATVTGAVSPDQV
jgi:hypothetical protein